MTDLSKTYNSEPVETKWYSFWETNGFFKPFGNGKPFSMVIPPPNVTGTLHIGHALNETLQDTIIRFKRMQGFRTLWIPGTDHAGIATQNVVEKALKKEGLTRHDLGREAFIKRVWEWKADHGSQITRQLRLLGSSVDWSHERFTMDEGLSNAVKETFIRLFNNSLIYRDEYCVNWCPRCHTALSDIEAEHRDVAGHFWHIRYPLAQDPSNGIVIATTRPETMFGDTAVAVHPKDPRYKDLIGKNLILPFSERLIPIIADVSVDRNFGTGAVKITPAHDPNDFIMGNNHGLDRIVIMDESAIMNENVPTAYQGLDRYACRNQLIQDLADQGLLLKTEDYNHSIGHCYRCQTVIEPYVSKQWFVNMKVLAQPAIDAVRSKAIRFTPSRWEKLYFDWMESIRPWCISRQIWWGHRIPIWYCDDCGQVMASKEEITTCTKCCSNQVHQDPDVLDTWFSSALWPFSTLGWPQKTDDLTAYYPTSLLITGYDIVTFWVSRMITMGIATINAIPFHDVYIHGLVRDVTGKKMSKSLGNVVDPVVAIKELGADALRFALASLVTSGGQDIKLSQDKLEASRNFVNKLWNASRYVLMQDVSINTSSNQPIPFADEWIIAKLDQTIINVTNQLDNYDYGAVTDTLYLFVWNDVCDWFIEMSKLSKDQSLPVMVFVLDTVLRLLHPLMPFVTEEIWQQIKEHPLYSGDRSLTTIMRAPWPTQSKKEYKETILSDMELLQQCIKAIRNLRAEMNIPPSKKGDVIFSCPVKNKGDVIRKNIKIIQFLGRCAQVTIIESLKEKPAQSSFALVDNIEIYLPLTELIDLEQEKSRLCKEIEKTKNDYILLSKKLANLGFLSNAPKNVISSEKEKERNLIEKLEQQKTQLNLISGIYT